MRFLLALLLSGSLATVACAQLPASSKAKSGQVVGWAVDSAGKPLAGATVHIYGTTMAGQNTRFEKPVGRDGKFSQRVPDGIYGVRAEYVHQWNGRGYTMALHPIDGITARSHDSEEGIPKDFVWKISGLRPGQTAGEPGTHNEPGKYWGGSLQIGFHQPGFDSVTVPDGATLVVTLNPEGPLFDGSRGSPLTFRRTFGGHVRATSYYYPADIPLGVYTLRVALEQGGATRALEVKKSLEFDAPFTAATQVEVLPDAASGAVLPIQITVKP